MRVASAALLALVLSGAEGLLAAPALAQDPIPDTTEAWRYYPLGLGDVWEYEHLDRYGVTKGYTRLTVVGDTVIAGNAYRLRLEENFDADGDPTTSVPFAVRFDTLTATVRAWWVSNERTLSCRLDADFESETDCDGSVGYVTGGYAQTVSIGQSAVTTSVKTYFYDESFVTYAAGIGEIASGYWDESSPLVYARVGGVEYGTTIPVHVEPPSEAPTALRIAVSPNPSAGPLMLALTVSMPQAVAVEVFDALGRRVHAEERAVSGEARLALDGRAWAPGLYVVRVTGSEGAPATARIVRR